MSDTISPSVTYLTQFDTLLVHPYCSKSINSFFLWLSNAPLYTCATLSLSIPLLLDIRVAQLLQTVPNGHGGACILSDRVFLQIDAQEWDCRVIWQRYF